MSGREIKFRAWHRIKKVMFDVFEMELGAHGAWGGAYDPEEGQCDNELCGIDGLHIDLMQYTGLKDKNGKEIYEGDILKGDKSTRSVIFDNGEFRAFNCTIKYLVDYGFVVIGNIYENPDLLKS